MEAGQRSRRQFCLTIPFGVAALMLHTDGTHRESADSGSMSDIDLSPNDPAARLGVAWRMHDSVQAALLLQPDWLRKRALEAAIWAEAELSKASVIQVIKDKLLRGEPSAQLRSTALDLRRSGPNLSEVSAVTFQRGMPSKNLYDGGQN